MKPDLQIGKRGQLTWIVDPSMTITLGGNPQATVFSTPNMIMLMERAAREALRPFLEDGEESVGTDVQIEHTGAATLGSVVHGVAEITSIEDRKVSFQVQAICDGREIGLGQHRRAVIQLSRFIDRLSKLSRSAPPAASLLSSKLQNTSNAAEERSTVEPLLRDAELRQFQTLQVTIEHQVATVTLNRPKSLNAVNVQMTDELESLVKWLAEARERVRVVILTGAGEQFCAGDEVKELQSLSIEEARSLSLRQARVYLAFEQLPQPIIAAVNGVALGAGCVAAYSCDFRIAAHGSRFGMPEIKLGWPPGYGIAQLTSIVGKARALELCLTGELISAKTALEWGLVHDVVAGQQLNRRAVELAKQLLKMPAEALRETKRLIYADEGSLPKVTHRADTEAYIRCLELPDAREGIDAFANKRSPRFTGT